MNDVVPELLETIMAEYSSGKSKSTKLRQIEKKIEAGGGTFSDADDYAEETSDILLKALENNLTEEKLPGGILYYNIAKRIIEPAIKDAYNETAKIAAGVHNNTCKNIGINIKAIVPALDQSRIDGLIEIILNKWTAARSASAV